MERASGAIRRCAVYTRSPPKALVQHQCPSEEGLEQDFNSLHAQREACEAFIKSQQGEGWRLRKTAYDDGGLSGGTMERPALQRLLADIRIASAGQRFHNGGTTRMAGTGSGTGAMSRSLCGAF
jgi:Resolvase, N terminal domain